MSPYCPPLVPFLNLQSELSFKTLIRSWKFPSDVSLISPYFLAEFLRLWCRFSLSFIDWLTHWQTLHALLQWPFPGHILLHEKFAEDRPLSCLALWVSRELPVKGKPLQVFQKGRDPMSKLGAAWSEEQRSRRRVSWKTQGGAGSCAEARASLMPQSWRPAGQCGI